MLARLLSLFHRSAAPRHASGGPPAELPFLSREQVAHLLAIDNDLPQIDWAMAAAWIANAGAKEFPGWSAAQARRAVAAAWLDELRDALTTDSRRWRTASVEGLAPMEGTTAARVAKAVDRSLPVIGRALSEIRGDPRRNPIPPIAVLALATQDEYYSFVLHFYEEEGEYATSGGMYIHASAEAFPVLVIAAQATWTLEHTVAHELTHHALRADRPELCAGLPMWAEEGLAQMMEEHVVRHSHFVFNREILQRHRSLWKKIGLDGFVSGDTFHSPEGQQQELSYNLAEALTRRLASERRAEFFSFARACRDEGESPEFAASRVFGASVQELAEELIWGRS